ncbi:MAG: TPM domain-containing protein [Pseudomonadota bacterium]
MLRYMRVLGACTWAIRGLALFLCAIHSVAGQPGFAAEPKFPQLSGRVVDEATLLSAPARERITGWLAEFERASKRQLVVVTVKDLQGYPIEDFGYRLGRAWGIGEKGRNTGAILLVAPKERTVRIEVGYGLEGELTDAVSRAIIEQNILPAFKDGNYEQGIINGTAAILKTLGWEGDTPGVTPAAPQSQTELSPLSLLILIILFVIFRFGWHGVFTGRHGPGVWGARSRGGFSGWGGSFGGGGASGRW